MDETPIKAGKSAHGKIKTGYFWPVYGEADEVCFPFFPSRSHAHVQTVLGLRQTLTSRRRPNAALRSAMRWAQRLKRVFGIDIEICAACGGPVRIIACIEDAEVVEQILTHLESKAADPQARWRPPCRAPPQRGLFD